MKLKDLNEAQTTIVKFSDIQSFDTMSAQFWVSMKDYIKEYKKIGKEKAIELVAKRVKKIGEQNYNSLKALSDKNKFGVPEFATASNLTKLKASRDGNHRIVILMDLVDSKTKIRKSKLEAELKKLQDLIGKED